MDSVFPAGACPLLSSHVLCCCSGQGWSSAWDSVWRLEIPGRAPEPPPSDTLSALHHQHDFHCCPRAGGAPSGENKQIWRPVECKCTDPAHLIVCEYGASHIVAMLVRGCDFIICLCVQCFMCTWRTTCRATVHVAVNTAVAAADLSLCMCWIVWAILEL